MFLQLKQNIWAEKEALAIVRHLKTICKVFNVPNYLNG